MVDSAGEAICELRKTSNGEACDVGTVGRLGAAKMCRAADVNDERSRISADAYNRRNSWDGKRTEATRCAD